MGELIKYIEMLEAVIRNSQDVIQLLQKSHKDQQEVFFWQHCLLGFLLSNWLFALFFDQIFYLYDKIRGGYERKK